MRPFQCVIDRPNLRLRSRSASSGTERGRRPLGRGLGWPTSCSMGKGDTSLSQAKRAALPDRSRRPTDQGISRPRTSGSVCTRRRAVVSNATINKAKSSNDALGAPRASHDE